MCLKKLFDGKGNEHNLDSEKIGNLDELSTEAKNSLVDAVNEVDGRIPNVTAEQEGYLKLSGGTMNGPIVLANPEEAGHAANKGYVDGKHFEASVTLTADGWTEGTSGFSQTAAVEGILETDNPHYGVVYSDELATALLEKKAFALVDDLQTADGSVTFSCFSSVPGVDLNIQMEVNR